MKLSIIDIGTQSLKHYIFEQNSGGHRLVYYKRHSEANLGETSTLSQETIERNLGILQRCLELNAAEGVTGLKLIGTEILRQASNAAEFQQAVRQLAGHDIEVITQDKEALYLYEGFIDVIPHASVFAAINIGGGSTEVVLGTKEIFGASIQLPFGAKFLRRTFGEHNHTDWAGLDAYLDREIQVSQQAPVMFITGVLDFITTVKPLIPFVAQPCDFPRHPYILALADYWEYIQALRATPVEKLKEYFNKDPNFCDGTTMGHTVYYTFAKKLGVKQVIPSRNDLTDGIVYEMGQK